MAGREPAIADGSDVWDAWGFPIPPRRSASFGEDDDGESDQPKGTSKGLPRWFATPKLPRVALPPQLAAMRLEQRTRAHAAHELRWAAYWRRELARQAESGAHTFDARDRELRSLVRGGISAALRAAVWPALCGVTSRLAHIAELYRQLVHEASAPDRPASAAIASIDLDIARTWPRHRAMDDASRAALRRVLVALALTEPDVGYCQGLNEVAATLLLLAASEAEAFGMLVHLLRVALPHGWYGESLSGSIAEGRVLALLLARHEPALSAHMRALGVEPPLFCTQMFLTIFISSLPFGVALRVWDCLLLSAAAPPASTQSGCGADVLLKVALALLRKHRAPLLRAQHAGEFVRALMDGARATADGDELLRIALEPSGWLIAQPAPNGLPTPSAFPSARALRALRAEQRIATERALLEVRCRQELRRAVRAAAESTPSLGAAAGAGAAEPAAASEGAAGALQAAAPTDDAPGAPASSAPAAGADDGRASGPEEAPPLAAREIGAAEPDSPSRAIERDVGAPVPDEPPLLDAHHSRASESDRPPLLLDPQAGDAPAAAACAAAERHALEPDALDGHDSPSAAETRALPQRAPRQEARAPSPARDSSRTPDDDGDLRAAAAAAQAAVAMASTRRGAGSRPHSARERGLASASAKLGGWLSGTSTLARDALERAKTQVERMGLAASSTLAAPSQPKLPPRASTLPPAQHAQASGGASRGGAALAGGDPGQTLPNGGQPGCGARSVGSQNGAAEHGACRPVFFADRAEPSRGSRSSVRDGLG